MINKFTSIIQSFYYPLNYMSTYLIYHYLKKNIYRYFDIKNKIILLLKKQYIIMRIIIYNIAGIRHIYDLFA